jgi:DNA (cytosine-5)-methyltransferase 1
MGNYHRAGVDNYYTVAPGKIRRLSEREAIRLMGFTDDFKLPVSRSQAYKQVGNSIVVDVIIEILRGMGIK